MSARGRRVCPAWLSPCAAAASASTQDLLLASDAGGYMSGPLIPVTGVACRCFDPTLA